MFKFILKKIREWREIQKEKKIKVLEEKLRWADEVLRSIKNEGEAMGELVSSGAGCARTINSTVEWNKNIENLYIEEKKKILRELAELGATV